MQCAYFTAGVCRSCTFMGVPYPAQLGAKEAHVRELLAPWPGLIWHAPFESVESGFRNKAKLVVGGSVDEPTLGILGPAGRGVDLSECGLYEPELAETFPLLAEFIARAGLTPFDVPTGRGELKNIIASVSPDGALMIRFVLRSTESLVRIRKHLPWLRAALPRIAVATVNLLPERKAVPEGRKEILLTDQEVLPMRFGDVTLHLRPQSFFQTNTAVAAGLYTQAREWVNRLVDDDEARAAGIRSREQGQGSRLTPQEHDDEARAAGTSASPEPGHALELWDLYCGVGGFALHCSGPGRSVLGVEISEQAVESARLSARVLHDAKPKAGTIRFLAGDANTAARAEGSAPDIAIVNPPRRGIGKLAEWIESSRIKHLIYSSCNPVSLAQDLAAMPGFEPHEARVFDMFPQTNHTETMVLASRR